MHMVKRNTVPVTSYVEPELKARMDRIVAANRHMSLSRQIDEALAKYLPVLEASFSPPTQEARSGKKKTAA